MLCVKTCLLHIVIKISRSGQKGLKTLPSSKNHEILKIKMTVLMQDLNFSKVVGLSSKEISRIIWRNAHVEAESSLRDI